MCWLISSCFILTWVGDNSISQFIHLTDIVEWGPHHDLWWIHHGVSTCNMYLHFHGFAVGSICVQFFWNCFRGLTFMKIKLLTFLAWNEIWISLNLCVLPVFLKSKENFVLPRCQKPPYCNHMTRYFCSFCPPKEKFSNCILI